MVCMRAGARGHSHLTSPPPPPPYPTAEEPHQDPNTIPNLVVFSGSSHPMLAEEVCDYLNIPVGKSVVKRYVRT